MELVQAHVNEQFDQALLQGHVFDLGAIGQGLTLDPRRSGTDARVFNLDPVIQTAVFKYREDIKNQLGILKYIQESADISECPHASGIGVFVPSRHVHVALGARGQKFSGHLILLTSNGTFGFLTFVGLLFHLVAAVFELGGRLLEIVIEAAELQVGHLMGRDDLEPGEVILLVGVVVYHRRQEYLATIS